MADEAQVVFVLGGPGAGKGTQCALISDTFQYVHLSAGDLLRAERDTGSEEGEQINEYIRAGQLVPIELLMKLLKKAIDVNQEAGTSKFLIDGFPRSQENIDGWNEAFGDNDKVQVKFVLFFNCPEDVMVERLLERGKTSGRADDNIESIRKRFVTYQQKSMPIIEYYRANGLLREIPTISSIEDVFDLVKPLFEEDDQKQE